MSRPQEPAFRPPDARRWSRRTESAALAVLLLVSFVLRLFLASRIPFMHDEYLWADLTDSVDLRPGSIRLPTGAFEHPAGQAYWNAPAAALLDGSIVGYRLASVLLGTGAVLAVYLLGRRIWGGGVGFLGASLLSLNEYHLGISHVCVQKNYLTFAVFTVVLFMAALRRPSWKHFLLTGAVTGLGAFTGITLLIWMPVLLLELVRRPNRILLKTPGPWIAAAVAALILAPYFASNVAGTGDDRTDLLFQASKIRLFEWSWAPLAMYVRPLYFHRVEGTIPEYVSMSTVPGTLLLLGAFASLIVLRRPGERFVQLLGWWPFVFFSLFSNPRGELFWGDFSLPAFVLLTSAMLMRLPRKGLRALAAAIVLGASAWKVVPLLEARERYFPHDWGEPPRIVVEQFRTGQQAMIVRFRERDHLELATLGSWRLPVFDYYLASLTAYRDALASVASPRGLRRSGWAGESFPGGSREAEVAWVEAEIGRFRTFRSLH